MMCFVGIGEYKTWVLHQIFIEFNLGNQNDIFTKNDFILIIIIIIDSYILKHILCENLLSYFFITIIFLKWNT